MQKYYTYIKAKFMPSGLISMKISELAQAYWKQIQAL